MYNKVSIIFTTHSDVTSQSPSDSTQRRGCFVRYRLLFVILFALVMLFIGVGVCLLIEKLVFHKPINDFVCGSHRPNWGDMVYQGTVKRPVLELIADMMKAENIKENLR